MIKSFSQLKTHHYLTISNNLTHLSTAAVNTLNALFVVPSMKIPERCVGEVRTLATARCRGEELLKQPQTEPSLAVYGVIEELPKVDSLRTDVGVEGRAIRMVVHPIPKPKVSTASGGVMSVRIVGVGHPISGRSDVIVEQARALFHEYDQVVLKHVACFDPILQEQGSSHHVENYVAFDENIVGVVDVDGSIESLVNATAAYIRILHASVEVEMDRVATQAEGLSHVIQFDM